MGCTVAELLSRVSSHELTEWMAYYGLEPWGEEREDYRAGVQVSTLANIHRDKEKRPQPFGPWDFFQRPGTPPEDAQPRQHWQGMLAAVRMINSAFGGTDKTKGAP